MVWLKGKVQKSSPLWGMFWDVQRAMKYITQLSKIAEPTNSAKQYAP